MRKESQTRASRIIQKLLKEIYLFFFWAFKIYIVLIRNLRILQSDYPLKSVVLFDRKIILMLIKRFDCCFHDIPQVSNFLKWVLSREILNSTLHSSCKTSPTSNKTIVGVLTATALARKRKKN